MKLCVLVLVSLLVSACQNSSRTPGRKAKTRQSGGGSGGSSNKPTMTCEQRWEELSLLQPTGREMTFHERQWMIQGAEETLLAESYVHRTVVENSGDKIAWVKTIQMLAPESGKVQSQGSQDRSTFLGLCRKGVEISDGERPAGYRPYFKEEIKILLKETEYVLSHERYDLSPGSRVTEKDELELWIGTKAPYQGLLFKKQRHFFQTVNSKLTERFIEKELLELKN